MGCRVCDEEEEVEEDDKDDYGHDFDDTLKYLALTSAEHGFGSGHCEATWSSL
jgi:hypothetical protein